MKIRWGAIGLVFLFAVVGISSSVLAQGGSVWSSSYQIQNLDSSMATVLIQYYDQTSGNLTASGTITVAGNSSKTVFPFVSGPFGDNIPGPSTFNGSAVLSSDKQLAVILNTQTSSSPAYGASTQGFSAGASSMSLPLIACNNSGYNTWFNVQNAGTDNANIKISYIPGAYGTAGITETATIKPGAAKTFDQSTSGTTGTKNCNQLKDGTSNKFVGSAKVESLNGQPIVASVMFMGTGTIKNLMGYNGFASGASVVNLPLVMAKNSGFYTSMQIQNAGTNSTVVTVTFGTNTMSCTGTCPVPNPESFTLAGGEAKTLIQSGGISQFSPHNDWNAYPGKYVGGATITQSGTEPLVAIVNQQSSLNLTIGSAYEGFDPASATGTINMPLIAANNSGYYTSFTIQAVSGNPAVSVHFSTNTGGGTLTNPADENKTLSTGEVWTLIQSGGISQFSPHNDWSTAGRYIGSAQVTATGGTIVAIVNFQAPTRAGDNFFTYDGFNQP